MKASELIQHLENGGALARGDEDHVELLTVERWPGPNGVSITLRGAGWGSALGTVEQRLYDIFRRPEEWIAIEDRETTRELEALAIEAMRQRPEKIIPRHWS